MYPCGGMNFHCNIPLVEIITHSLLRWITLIAASNSYKSNWRIIFMFYCIQSRNEFKLAYNINNVFQRYVLPHFMHIYEPFYTPRIYSIILMYIQCRYEQMLQKSEVVKYSYIFIQQKLHMSWKISSMQQNTFNGNYLRTKGLRN